MMEIDAIYGLTIVSKRVNVAVAQSPPIAKLYTKFEGGAGRAHEVALVYSECLVEESDVGQGRFPDAHSANLIGLDKLYRDVQVFVFVR